jgi:hypothetical protein
MDDGLNAPEAGEDYANGSYANGSYGQETESQYNNTQDWRASLAPELQGVVQKFNSPESLAKAYADAQNLISKKVGEFSQQDWQSYAAIQEQLMGVPSSLDGYAIDTAPIAEGKINTFQGEDLEALKEMSHALGLNNQQAQGLYTVLNEMGNQIMQAQEAGSQEYAVSNYNELAQDWGNAYEGKLQAISNCVEHILPSITGVSSERIKQEVYQSGACNSALLMKIFSAIGELGSEGRSAGYNNLAPMDANMRLEHLKSDPNTAAIMADKLHPMHQQVKNEFRALTQIKYGER